MVFSCVEASGRVTVPLVRSSLPPCTPIRRYDTGDDSMKKIIGEAMMKSRGGGGGDPSSSSDSGSLGSGGLGLDDGL